MIQEGNIGLMKAVRRFNPEVGVRLVSFAVHWIKAEIHEYVLRNWRIVKVATTKAQRKLFFNPVSYTHLWAGDELGGRTDDLSGGGGTGRNRVITDVAIKKTASGTRP